VRYFDDVAPGDRIHVGTWSLERDDIVTFAQHWDPQPFHIDEQLAASSIFGGLTASSLHLFAICTRLFHDLEPRFAVLAMLGKDEVRFPSPARPGDVLTYETECHTRRVSRSSSDRGIIMLEDTLRTQHDVVVLSQQVTLMIARADASIPGK
jgi:acyl dehydratase